MTQAGLTLAGCLQPPTLTPHQAPRHPETGEVYDIIFGTFFLCSAPPDSENFESLSPEQISRYTEHFKCPEFFPGISLSLEVK